VIRVTEKAGDYEAKVGDCPHVATDTCPLLALARACRWARIFTSPEGSVTA
jgi:hypothetical protein